MADQTHTDSPFCCHGQHFAPKTVLEAAAWAVVREAPRELSEAEKVVEAMLDAVRFALDASDDGGCGSDWRESTKARAVVAAMRPLVEGRLAAVETPGPAPVVDVDEAAEELRAVLQRLTDAGYTFRWVLDAEADDIRGVEVSGTGSAPLVWQDDAEESWGVR